jgi:hypothetical protein
MTSSPEETDTLSAGMVFAPLRGLLRPSPHDQPGRNVREECQHVIHYACTAHGLRPERTFF